jgi:hypothetical protein
MQTTRRLKIQLLRLSNLLDGRTIDFVAIWGSDHAKKVEKGKEQAPGLI